MCFHSTKCEEIIISYFLSNKFDHFYEVYSEEINFLVAPKNKKKQKTEIFIIIIIMCIMVVACVIITSCVVSALNFNALYFLMTVQLFNGLWRVSNLIVRKKGETPPLSQLYSTLVTSHLRLHFKFTTVLSLRISMDVSLLNAFTELPFKTLPP